jgi:hypothetical protein
MTRGGLETVSTESGTEGSNPALSSGESCANHGLRGDVRHGACSAARDDPQVETLSPGRSGGVQYGSGHGLNPTGHQRVFR